MRKRPFQEIIQRVVAPSQAITLCVDIRRSLLIKSSDGSGLRIIAAVELTPQQVMLPGTNVSKILKLEGRVVSIQRIKACEVISAGAMASHHCEMHEFHSSDGTHAQEENEKRGKIHELRFIRK